jgi:hypothetical protein
MKTPTLLSSLLLGLALLSAPSLAQAQTNTSTEATGLAFCMGSNMRCQILRHESLTVSGTVYFSGGGFSGSSYHTGYRCGTSTTYKEYIEVYVNDPNFNWPTYCVRSGGSLTLVAGNRYDFRGPSISGSNAWTHSFSLHARTLQAPTNLFVGTNGSNGLYWEDNSWGESGTAIERRTSALFETPTVSSYSYRIGVTAPYFDNTYLRQQLDPSARQYCLQNGYATFASYAITGPVGGVHTYWNGTQWYTTGNNTVFYMKDLVCKGAWSQLGTVGANVTSYTDNTPVLGTTYDYRVRAFMGSTYSGYSNTESVTTAVAVGIE